MFSFLCKQQDQVLKHLQYTISENLKDIGDYQFPEVVLQRAKKELGCTDEELEIIQTSLLHYFLVVKEHKQVEMMDKKADILWHTFLLDTKAYMKFCSQYVGFYVHHNPYIDERVLSQTEINYITGLYKVTLENNVDFRTKRFSKMKQYSTSLKNNNSSDNNDMSNVLIYWLLWNEMFDSSEAIASSDGTDVQGIESTPDNTENYNNTDSISNDSSSYDSGSSCSSCSSCSSS